MRRILTLLIWGLVFIGDMMAVGKRALAAIDHRAPIKKLNHYVRDGLFIGGAAGRGFSLLDIKRKFGKKSKMERIVLTIGDELGAPLLGVPGYFHLEIDQNHKRVFLDLAQLQRSLISEKEMVSRFADSPYLKLERVVYDPEDKATGLSFKMKQNLAVEVLSPIDGSQPARIVLDLIPLKARSLSHINSIGLKDKAQQAVNSKQDNRGIK
ncbi:MAG: hypothetical protein KDD35_05105 [Bdellovibrionales bacterium]|nr:hypothetical protein [Bdellovibrionales bacterium]